MAKEFVDTLNPDEVSIVWQASIYDGILLEGHCWYKEQYCFIKSNGPYARELIFEIYKLEGQILINELARRKLFEDIVGYHLTKNIKNYSGCNSLEDNKLYYDNYKSIFPDIDLESLECLGGWSFDNAKWADDND
jgi:hypothetical protein